MNDARSRACLWGRHHQMPAPTSWCVEAHGLSPERTGPPAYLGLGLGLGLLVADTSYAPRGILKIIIIIIERKAELRQASELRQCNVSEVSVKVKTRGVLGAGRIKNTRLRMYLSSGQLWVDRLAGMLGGCGCGYRARRKIFLF